MPPHHRRSPSQRRKRQPQQLRVDPLMLGRMLQRRKAGGLLLALVIIVVIALLDRWAGVLPVDDDWHRYDGQTFEVTRAVDGDTIILNTPDGDEATTRIRLWGVNTAEMNFSDPNEPPEPWAQEATDFTQRLTQGQRVTLHLQEHRLRGGFGRILAYVELPDGRLLNAELIKNGLSKHDDRWSHDQAQAYDALEDQARQEQRGLWAP